MGKRQPRTKKPIGRPPTGNYLTQLNVRCTQEVFEQIEVIKQMGGYMSDSDAIRGAIRNLAETYGWKPMRPKT